MPKRSQDDGGNRQRAVARLKKGRLERVRDDRPLSRSGRIVGRTAEVKHLEQSLEAALQGQRQIIFVTGEPGIGKTTLVDAFLDQRDPSSDLWISRGQCIEHYGAGEAYLPLLEATNRLSQTADRSYLLAELRRHAPSWLVQLPSLTAPAEREALQQQLQGTTQERMLREAAEVIIRVTAQHGVILILEDLHWCDVSTLEWLAYIAQRREPMKLLLIGTYRPADVLAGEHPLRGVVQELRAKNQCEELPLAPLSEAAVGEYLNGFFPDTPQSAEVRRAMYHRTGGNPLFMVNVVDYLVQQMSGQNVVHNAINGIEKSVPENLRQLIEQHIDRLPEEDRQLLEVASVVGVEFSVATTAASLHHETELIEAQCEALARKGQFIQAQGVEEWPDGTLNTRYSFRHALYQNVLYDRLAEARRIRLHREIGECRETAFQTQVGEIATELAMHFERGRDLPRAIRYLKIAGDNAMRRNAHREAITSLNKGLQLLATLPEVPQRIQAELSFQVSLGAAFMTMKGYGAPEAGQAYDRARALSQHLADPRQHFRAVWGLWSFYYVRGQHQIARELAEHCLLLAEQLHDSVRQMQAHEALGASLFAVGAFVDSRSHLEESIRLYDAQPQRSNALQNPGVDCRAYLGLVLWWLGYPDQALQRAQEAAALAESLSHPLSVAFAQGWLSWVSYFRRDWPALRAQTETLMALSSDQELPLWLAMGVALHARTLVEHGQLTEGIAQSDRAQHIYETTGVALFSPASLTIRAEMSGACGDWAEAIQRLEAALAVIVTDGERFYEAEVYRLKGELILNDERRTRNDERQKKPPGTPSVHHSSFIIHRSEEAEACFQQALEIARRQQAKSWELRAALSLGRLWRAQGKTDEARQLLEEIYGWFTEGFETTDLQEAEALLKTLGSQLERKTAQPDEAAPASVLEPLPPLPATPSVSDVQTDQHSSFVVQHSLPPTPNPQSPTPTTPNIFRQEGDFWTLAFAGEVCRIKNLHGMQYIAQLLQQPHEDIHVLTLATGKPPPAETPLHRSHQGSAEGLTGSPLQDAGEVLDPQARAAYKHRLDELQTELEEAQQFNDVSRAERLQEERDFLSQALSQAFGLGGRARKVGSTAERARVNVTKRIRVAIKRIDASHPALGAYLRQTIHTGTFCSYTPDPQFPVSWQGNSG